MFQIDSVRELAAQLEERAKKVQEAIDEASKDIKQEKLQWEAEKKEMASRYAINDNIVELNVGRCSSKLTTAQVGGRYFTTFKSVLCKQEHSMLGAMFSGRHPLAKDSSGRYFVDSDGKVSYCL